MESRLSLELLELWTSNTIDTTAMYLCHSISLRVMLSVERMKTIVVRFSTWSSSFSESYFRPGSSMTACPNVTIGQGIHIRKALYYWGRKLMWTFEPLALCCRSVVSFWHAETKSAFSILPKQSAEVGDTCFLFGRLTFEIKHVRTMGKFIDEREVHQENRLESQGDWVMFQLSICVRRSKFTACYH
jgi:hypothetical protein